MAKTYDSYSDQEYQLHQIVSWAMLGLISTENLDRPALFGGFLFDLFRAPRGGELSGEPGWVLERIELDENFPSRHPYIKAEHKEMLAEWCRIGEREAFWFDNDEQNQSVISSPVFWKVVACAFDDFVKERPGRKKEMALIVAKFPQLQRE